MMCRCEPLRSSGYGHMADGIRPEQAVQRTACSAVLPRSQDPLMASLPAPGRLFLALEKERSAGPHRRVP
jgi:hypothetical protein